MKLSHEPKMLAELIIAEAIQALTQKPVQSTTLERIRLFVYANDQIVCGQPQPLQYGLGLNYVLEHISLPLKETDLILGRISEEVPDEEGEALFQRILHDPNYHETVPNWIHEGGHTSFCWDEAVTLGLSGLRARAEEELNKRTAAQEATERLDYLKGAILVYDALSRYLLRYAEAARKAGLTEAAQACEGAAHVPQTFREALQLLWIINLVYCSLIVPNPTLALGKLDRILYPFYERDLREGRLTREEAGLLILDFYCKNNLNMGRGEHQLSGKDPSISTGWARCLNFDAPQYMTLCGTYADGTDACSDLTALMLETIVPRFKNPVIVVHYGPQMAQKHPDLWRTCVSKMRDSASMMLYNEADLIAAYQRAGADPEDAAEFEHYGCNWPCIPGMELGAQSDDVYPSVAEDMLAFCEEQGRSRDRLAYNRTGELLLSFLEILRSYAASGQPLTSMDPIYEGLKEVFTERIDWILVQMQQERLIRMQKAPGIIQLNDCFFKETIERATDRDAGGCKYMAYLVSYNGFATLADSLTAVDELVVRQKKFTLKQLVEILDDNFEHYPLEHALCKRVPKFGSGDETANQHAARLLTMCTDVVSDRCSRIENPEGAPRILLQQCIQNDTTYLAVGKEIGATPDGRLAGAPISQNCQPSPGASVNGLTARLLSMTALPFDRILAGAHNLQIQPRNFKGEEGLDRLAALLSTYFDLGGLQIQLSAVDTEELKDAQKNPDAHRDLLVRITGYSAVFVDMCKLAQDEVIRRS